MTASAPTNPNNAVCIKTTGLGQSCSISQSSATKDNVAVVYESTGPNGKTTGLTQSALFTASITQQVPGGSDFSNTACVYQVISMDGSTNVSGKKGAGANVALEAHQSVKINQDTTGSGTNNADQSATPSGTCNAPDVTGLLQSQTLTSTASASGPIVQNENAANGGPTSRSMSSRIKASVPGTRPAPVTQSSRRRAISRRSPVPARRPARRLPVRPSFARRRARRAAAALRRAASSRLSTNTAAALGP